MNNAHDWNVLIVDDEPDNIGVIALILEFHGATVRSVVSGAECLDLMNADIPNLLLVDIQMPVMNGFELFKHIKANKQWMHIPIIAVTAQAMSADREVIMSAGFDGYIAKPVNVVSFVDEIKAILNGDNGTS